MPSVRDRGLAGGAAGFAAFLWATYYVFVLLLPSAADGLIVEVPFLVGAVAFAIGYPGRPAGGPRHFFGSFASRGGLLRGGVFVLLQLDVVVATRLAGAVDAALVTLLADVVATPLLVLALASEDAAYARSRSFWGGVLIASIGAGWTILGTGPASALGWEAALSLVPLPFLVAVYFVAVNHEAKRVPAGEVLGAASLMAFVVGGVGGLLVFGPRWAAVPLDPVELLLLVVVGITSFYAAPWAYFWAAGRTTLVLPAVLQALIPVFTLLLVALLRLQEVAWVAWIGVPLAFLGSVVAVLGPRSAVPLRPTEGTGAGPRSETPVR